MRSFTAALRLSSCLVVLGGAAMMPAIANADSVNRTYIACNQYNECWRVHQKYTYSSDQQIAYHDGDWYDAHQGDPNVRWQSDPSDDRGWYDRDGSWHTDPGARALAGGATGAAIGAAVGCLVTLPIGCAPGAAVGAAVGGGTGAVAGAASTPRN